MIKFNGDATIKLNASTITGGLAVLLLGAGVIGVFNLNSSFIRFESSMTVWAEGTDKRITKLENLHVDRFSGFGN